MRKNILRALVLCSLIVPAQAFAGRETWEILETYVDGVQISSTAYGTGKSSLYDQSLSPFHDIAFAVNGSTGIASAWAVNLEASLDQSTWTIVATHTNATGDGQIIFLTAKSAPYWRFNVTSLTLGSSASKIILRAFGLR